MSNWLILFAQRRLWQIAASTIVKLVIGYFHTASPTILNLNYLFV